MQNQQIRYEVTKTKQDNEKIQKGNYSKLSRCKDW